MARVPNVNASLMHEIRMVAYELLRHRENLAFWQGKKKSRPAAASTAIKCHTCVRNSRVSSNLPLRDAVTYHNGTALCAHHV